MIDWWLIDDWLMIDWWFIRFIHSFDWLIDLIHSIHYSTIFLDERRSEQPDYSTVAGSFRTTYFNDVTSWKQNERGQQYYFTRHHRGHLDLFDRINLRPWEHSLTFYDLVKLTPTSQCLKLAPSTRHKSLKLLSNTVLAEKSHLVISTYRTCTLVLFIRMYVPVIYRSKLH